MSTEFRRIARFSAFFDESSPTVVVGPGDDCALTRPAPGHLLVSKVDQVVEGVHFGPWARPEEIGHKALAVSLSDLAAAGATPRWILVALALSERVDDRFLSGIARGMSRLARRARVSLVGGNLTTAAQLSIAVTALGEVRPERALRRSGARPGDALVVSGRLGAAALGLERLRAGRRRVLGEPERAQLAPEPRLALGAVAGRWASAAVDVSDGLLQDLGHLCERSGVGAVIERAALPLHPDLEWMGEKGLRLGLAGGEDYELLLAVPPENLARLRLAARRRGEALCRIGTVIEGRGIRLVDEEGRALELPASPGWDPFRAE